MISPQTLNLKVANEMQVGISNDQAQKQIVFDSLII